MRIPMLCAIGFAVLTSSSVFGSSDCTENCVTKLVTDFRGKPPFKRRIEVLPADSDEVEITTSEPVWVSVKTVDFSGKPPFKRRVERIEQAEAQEPEVNSSGKTARKGPKANTGNSIFKRH